MVDELLNSMQSSLQSFKEAAGQQPAPAEKQLVLRKSPNAALSRLFDSLRDAADESRRREAVSVANAEAAWRLAEQHKRELDAKRLELEAMEAADEARKRLDDVVNPKSNLAKAHAFVLFALRLAYIAFVLACAVGIVAVLATGLFGDAAGALATALALLAGGFVAADVACPRRTALRRGVALTKSGVEAANDLKCET